MKSSLLAFQIAKPVERDANPVLFDYDPLTQRSVWSGDGKAVASYYCTYLYNSGGQINCNAYAYYCTTTGPLGSPWGYFCDS